MEQLKLGKVSWRELSTWFGLSPDTITKAKPKAKEKKLNILATYAKYHLDEKGKLIIDEIYEPIYSKAYDIIAQEYKKEWGKGKDSHGEINKTFKKLQIDTCARVGLHIWYNNKYVNKQIEKTTAQNYTNKIKIEEYGHNHLGDEGTKGTSKYVWLDLDEESLLPPDKMKILEECAQEAYNNTDAYTATVLAAIQDDYKKGNIKREEYLQASDEVRNSKGGQFELFQTLLMDKLGFIPTKRTQLIDKEQGAF